MNCKEEIYNMMNGQLAGMKTLQIGGFLVEDEFAEGKECGELYAKIYAANRRLCRRLKTEEDTDVESIVNNMFRITKILALKMYDCGVESGKQGYAGQEG